MSKSFEAKYISMSKLYNPKISQLKQNLKYEKLEFTPSHSFQSLLAHNETNSVLFNNKTNQELISSSLIALFNENIDDLDQHENVYYTKSCCKRMVDLLNYKSDKLRNQIKLFTFSKATGARKLLKKKSKELFVSYSADSQQAKIYVNEFLKENETQLKNTLVETRETNLINNYNDSEAMAKIKIPENELESIIAFVNPKSGGLKGKMVYEKFKNVLKSENVYDLSRSTPGQGLQKHKNTRNLKVIACGGDGTVGWVLSEVDKENFLDVPGVAILPLGTGNELSRTLGCGTTYDNEPLDNFIKSVIKGRLVTIDRWSITTTVMPKPNSSKRPRHQNDELPVNVFNDFFSIGADAKIALDFHLAREKNPDSFKSQFSNKFEHVKIFSKDLFSPSCKNLISCIKEFELDGVSYLEKIKQKNFHSLVFLNIPSYANGTNPWNNGEKRFGPQSYSDGKLEVVGFQTSDLMLIQLGGHGVNIAQASSVRIVTDVPLPMQVDGEPILLTQSEIIIEKKNQASMIQMH